MRRNFLLLGATLVVCAGLVLFMLQSQTPDAITDARGEQEVSIILTDTGFEPNAVRITKGAVVVFTTTRKNQFWPASNPHPTHEIYSGFDPRHPIAPGEAWSFTLDTPGVWSYHDHIRSYFTGTIHVEE